MELIKIEQNYNIEKYKDSLQEFYKNIQLLFKKLQDLNSDMSLMKERIEIENLHITSELDLKNNKRLMDIINDEFKLSININNHIKKQLNTWKSAFAGQKGLDTLLTNAKDELLQPLKDKQLEYHKSIMDKSLKEQAQTKTTLGIRCYEKIKILSIDADKLPHEYWVISEPAILSALKSGKDVIGVTYELVKEYK